MYVCNKNIQIYRDLCVKEYQQMENLLGNWQNNQHNVLDLWLKNG